MRHIVLRILLGLAVFSALQVSSVSYAETVFFGPTEYQTSWGGVLRPQQVFTCPTPGEGIIRLEKITPDTKINSGHIFLNRKHISLTEFLRSQDETYEIPVNLAERNHFLLALGGKKGAILRLTVVGQYGPAVTLSAQPATIREGETATLTWITQDANSATISPSVGQVPLNGTVSVVPLETTTYTLLASNDAGSSEATSSITVLPRPPTISLTVDQAAITKNESATLSWLVENADTVSINQGIGPVGSVNSLTVSPTNTTTYIIIAENLGGTTTASITITVVPFKIFITGPQDMATVLSKVDIQGYLDTKATYATVAVNGQRAIVDGHTFFLNSLELPAGDNEISVISSDSNQNQATASITVFVEERDPDIALIIGDPIAFAPYITTIKADINGIELAPDSAILTFDGPGDIESQKISDTEFVLTFTTPGLYTVAYSISDSYGAPLSASTRITIKPAFTAEDWQDLQDDVASLEALYNSQVATQDIEALRVEIQNEAQTNPDFSSATLSGGAICLVYKGLIPIILDLPDPNGTVTDGSFGPGKTVRIEEVK